MMMVEKRKKERRNKTTTEEKHDRYDVEFWHVMYGDHPSEFLQRPLEAMAHNESKWCFKRQRRRIAKVPTGTLRKRKVPSKKGPRVQADITSHYVHTLTLSINCPAAVYNPMIDENISTSATAVQVVGFESYGIAFGKFFFGACSDMLGARRVMEFVLALCPFCCFCLVLGANVLYRSNCVSTWSCKQLNMAISYMHRSWYSSANIAEGTRLLGFSSWGGAYVAKLCMEHCSCLECTGGLCFVTWRYRSASLDIFIASSSWYTYSQWFHWRKSIARGVEKNIKILLSAKEFWCAAASMGCCTIVKRIGVITPIFYFATSKAIISVGNSVAMGIIYQTGLFRYHWWPLLTKLKVTTMQNISNAKLNMMSTPGCLTWVSRIISQNSSYFILCLEAVLAFGIAFGVLLPITLYQDYLALFGGENEVPWLPRV